MFIKILLALIVLLIICLIWTWYMLAKPPKMEHKPFNIFKFKTGDIILFHAYNNINPVFIASYWGHIGIVYKNPNDDSRPLLFEATKTTSMKNCEEKHRCGIVVSDLQSRIEKYPGKIACKFLNKHVSKQINSSFIEFMKYAKDNMYYSSKVFSNGIKKKLGNRYNCSTNCGEIVLLSLIKLNLLPYEIFYKKIAHHLLYIIKLTNLNNNYYYHKPIELTFNPF